MFLAVVLPPPGQNTTDQLDSSPTPIPSSSPCPTPSSSPTPCPLSLSLHSSISDLSLAGESAAFTANFTAASNFIGPHLALFLSLLAGAALLRIIARF